jgi:hypothetical protein
MSGTCIAVNEQSVGCDDIARISQCVSGGGLAALTNKCGVYDSVCKTLCSLVNEASCKSSGRSNDCTWMEKNGTQYLGGCANKVLWDFVFYICTFFLFLFSIFYFNYFFIFIFFF